MIILIGTIISVSIVDIVQRLPVKSEGQKRGAPSNRPCRPWPDRSVSTLHTNTEVLGREELDMENVKRGETYLGNWGIHIRDDTTRLLHGRNNGTKKCY